MRQVFLDKGVLAVKQVAEPLLTDDTMLIAVHYSFISSGTEAATISDSLKSTLFKNVSQKVEKLWASLLEHGLLGPKLLVKERMRGGLIQHLGYSAAGRVVAVGRNITNFRVGDLVACAGVGIANHADIICVPPMLAVKISHERFMQAASITTIGAIALQGVRRAQLQLGDTVCVLGLGLLGQLTVQLAQRAGCRVIGIDLLEDRLELAKKYGASFVFHSHDPSLKSSIDFLTNNYGVDVTLIAAASKSNSLVQQAMEMTRAKGKVIIVGDVGLHLQRNPLYRKEIDLLISSSSGPGRYDVNYEHRGIDYPYAYVRWTENRNMQAIISMIEQNQLHVLPLVSHCVDIINAVDGYKKLQQQQGLGVLISYLPAKNASIALQEKREESRVNDNIPLFKPARKAKLRVGVVGAGGFARGKLLPILAGLESISIEAIVDVDAGNALSVGRLYGASKIFTDDKELFRDNELIDVVLVTSPHIYHADQIMSALSKGKAVFAEKPMVTTRQQLDQFAYFLKSNSTSFLPLCVDYNRSFSPFIKKIKEQVRQRSTPLMIHYRMNTGRFAKDHWTQTEIGGGGLIGQACHIFELFCFLTEAQPHAVSVETLNSKLDSLVITDNASIQISFSDGSVCSLIYTALGNAQASKERMEIFYEGKTIILDDYRTLQGFGFSSSFNQVAKTQDKGHANLMRQFFSALRRDPMVMPMSIDHLMTVAELTLTVNDLALIGGGSKQY